MKHIKEMKDIKEMKEVAKQLRNASRLHAKQAAKVESMIKRMSKKK